MKVISPLWLLRAVLLIHLLWLATSTPVSGAVTAGSLAIIGYDDAEDSFTVVALDAIAAGEEIYFTNNGWNNAQGQFYGAATDQGAGNESLLKLTVTDGIAKGSVFSSNANGAGWSWTNSGLVPGQDPDGFGEFSNLALDYESDQIYIFQGTRSNPLLNPTKFIYALHFGSADYPTFSDADGPLTGALPPGLSESDHTAVAQTNFSMHGDADGQHSTWGIDLNSPVLSDLQLHGAHRDQWLDAIASGSNWAESPSITDGTQSTSTLFVMPEPSRGMLLMLGGIGLLRRRQRA
jgi:hypothetical protein